MKISDIVIGASEAAAPLGLDEYTTRTRFFMEKTGRVGRSGKSIAAWLGQKLEAGIGDAFAEDQCVKLHSLGTLRSTERPWLRATPDRVVFWDEMPEAFRKRFRVAEGTNALVEIKTTGLANFKSPAVIDHEWGPDGSDIVPAPYVVQTLVQGSVVNEVMADLMPRFSVAVVVALLPGRGLCCFVIHLLPDVTDKILNGLDDFVHEYLVPDVAPEGESETDWKLIASYVSRPKTSDTLLDAIPEVERMAEEYRTVSLFHDETKKSKQRLRAHLLRFIGNHYGIKGSFGKLLHTGGKTAPALNKDRFADAVTDLARELVHSDDAGDKRVGSLLLELEREHTKATTKGRQMRPVWSDGAEEDDEE